jgi:hypothetical protein
MRAAALGRAHNGVLAGQWHNVEVGEISKFDANTFRDRCETAMDFLFVVFSGYDKDRAGIRIMAEPWACARYRGGKLQHERRFAATTISSDDGHCAVWNHILHDPPPLGRWNASEGSSGDNGQRGKLARLRFRGLIGERRRRRLGAFIIVFALRWRRCADDGELRRAGSFGLTAHTATFVIGARGVGEE